MRANTGDVQAARGEKAESDSYSTGVDTARVLSADERLSSNDMLEALLTGWFYQHTGEEIFELGKAHRFPAGYVATVEDLDESEQLRERHFFAEDDHPRAGHLRFPGQLWLSSEHGWQNVRAPELGQHTDEVLGELGYDDERRAQLRAAGALGGEVHA